ncbi:MAG: hypothetical protein DCC74_09565 [Proteobacteria bacterium]|nr:MAG: hypothetical protein DCC74_09565 [Pseudomonadota bacterium]
MWRFLLNLSRTRRARRAAAAMIVPLVEASRRRLGGIAEAAWSDPYIIGFMAMLITLISRVEVGRLDNDALGAVQVGAWQDITGLSGSTVGEDMLHLGAAHDRNFEAGCRDAVTFGSMLVARSLLFAGAGKTWRAKTWQAATDPSCTPPAARDDVAAAWEQFFDANVARRGETMATVLGTDSDKVWR